MALPAPKRAVASRRAVVSRRAAVSLLGAACAAASWRAPVNLPVAFLSAGPGSLAPPRWQGVISAGIATESPKALARQPAPSSTVTGTSMCLAGALVAVALLTRSSKEEAATTAHVWKRYPAIDGMQGANGQDESRGPDYKMWVKQYRKYSHAMKYRQRYRKQKKILEQSNIWWATSKFVHWYPNRDKFNLYKGPESHPDNPYFPAASDGWQAVRTWAPAKLAATTTPKTGFAFVAGAVPRAYSAKRAVAPRGATRSAIVMHAHKKAASCSKNQGGGSKNAHWYGVKLKGFHGSAIKCGDMILMQKGCNWWPGENVVMGRDFTIHATKDGIVQWRGKKNHKQVSVIPWEYVREKCVWSNSCTLMPKAYEPWMNGTQKGPRVRTEITKMRQDWLKTEEGIAWQKKKEEKQEKQRVIQKKIRAYRKLRKQGVAREEAKAKVDAVLAAVPTGEPEK